jgi:hypothetical protein
MPKFRTFNSSLNSFNLFRLTRKEPLRLTLKEIICPLFCSRRYKETFLKIEEYIRLKLSLDNILKDSEEFDRVKKYLFNSHELYVFENLDRVSSRIFNMNLKEQFDFDKFKLSYQQTLANSKFLEIIG